MTMISDFDMNGFATTSCLRRVLRGYLACALWSSTDDYGDPLNDNYDIDCLSSDALDRAEADVCAFMSQVWDDTDLDLSPIEPEQIGHDLWLTRDHHGTGFWDRGLGELGDALTKIAQCMGTADLYVSDDGELEFF